MSYKLKTDFLKDAPKHRSNGAMAGAPRGVTVHNGATKGTARQLGIYGNYNSPEVSYHYSIDEAEAYHLMPDNWTAWHAGNRTGNNTTIAIEMGRDLDYDSDLYDRTEANAAHLVATLLHKYGLTVNQVYRHYDWNGKYCPHRFFEAEAGKTKRRTTAEFKALVKKELEQIKAGEAKPVPTPKPEPVTGKVYRVQIGAFGNADNAAALAERARKDGYYVWQFRDLDGLIKVQIASYAELEGAAAFAKTVEAKGYVVWIREHKLEALPAPQKPIKEPVIAVGDKVIVQPGTSAYNGAKLADFVYKTTYTVLEKSGDRVVIGLNGVTTAAVKIDALKKV